MIYFSPGWIGGETAVPRRGAGTPGPVPGAPAGGKAVSGSFPESSGSSYELPGSGQETLEPFQETREIPTNPLGGAGRLWKFSRAFWRKSRVFWKFLRTSWPGPGDSGNFPESPGKLPESPSPGPGGSQTPKNVLWATFGPPTALPGRPEGIREGDRGAKSPLQVNHATGHPLG